MWVKQNIHVGRMESKGKVPTSGGLQDLAKRWEEGLALTAHRATLRGQG